MKKARANTKKISGIVISGKSRGLSLGFPTANIHCDDLHDLPDKGIWATRVVVRGKHYMGATSFGENMTFNAEGPTLETHILNFSGDILGERIEIEFIKRLRDMVRFPTVEALQKQIQKDIGEVKTVCLQELSEQQEF